MNNKPVDEYYIDLESFSVMARDQDHANELAIKQLKSDTSNNLIPTIVNIEAFIP